MPRQKLKRLIAGALCGAMLLALPACQEDPEGSIVAHKDMEKLISEGAKSTDESRVDAEQLIEDAKKTESYETTLDNSGLKVKAEVNAQVELPEVDKLSIYRVKQKPFTQEFLDKVRAELCGDVELFDYSATQVATKKDIEENIRDARENIAEYEEMMHQMANNPEVPEDQRQDGLDSIEPYRQEMQEEIDRMQAEYESAPDEVDLADYPTDYKIHTYKELYEGDPDNGYYGWLYGLGDEKGDSGFSGVSDGSDGRYRSLYVQNNADYSNKLYYYDDLGSLLNHGGVIVEDTRFEPYMPASDFGIEQGYESFWKEKGVPSPVISGDFGLEGDMVFVPVGSKEISFTEEEAREKAEELLGKLGITDFKFSEGGKYSELLGGEGEDFLYDVYYVLRYTRELEGVLLTQSSGAKFVVGQDTSNPNRKQMWPGENIEIRINDRGIVGFQYNAPLEITETVVEGTSLKTFDEVKGTFEQMLPMLLAEEDFEVTAKVDRVRLSYSRISEKDSFDTGLVVPVWSFEGETQAYFNGYPMYDRKGTLMAINAIDGSVIDADLGY